MSFRQLAPSPIAYSQINNQPVTNEDIVKCLFGAKWQEAYVTSYSYPPDTDDTTVKAIMWSGKSVAQSGTSYMRPDRNNYITVSTYGYDADGKYRRREELFSGLYFLPLDDIVGKHSDPTTIGFKTPTIILETSKDNFQWFYKLSQPIMDPAIAKAFLGAIIKNGKTKISDDIADLSRNVRLLGYNNKLKYGTTPFEVQLRAYNPDIEYTPEEMCKWVGVDFDTISTVSASQQEILDTSDKIFQDTLVQDLMRLSMVPNGKISTAGWLTILCPWEERHTSVDNSTGVCLNLKGQLRFKCFHSSCAASKIGDVRLWVKANDDITKAAMVIANPSNITRKVVIPPSGVTRADSELYFKENWAVFNGEYVRLADGKLFSKHKALIETAQWQWTEQGLTPTGQPKIKMCVGLNEYEKSSDCQRLTGMGMYPRHQGMLITPDGQYNYMKDWPHEPINGSCEPWLNWMKYFHRDCPEFEDHVHNFFANIIQRPWSRNNTIIQYISNLQGVGKSFTLGWFGRMLGDLAAELGPDRLYGTFNGYLAGKVYVTVDEPSSDNVNHANKLKAIVTADTINMENKGVDMVTIVNYVNYTFTTNAEKVTKMSRDSRREAIHRPASLTQAESKVLIDIVKDWCDNQQGFNKMMWFYKNRDISKFDPYAHAPNTEAKEDSIRSGESSRVQFAEEVYDWVQYELGGHAAITATWMKALIQHFDYEDERLSARTVSNSFQEFCDIRTSYGIGDGTGKMKKCLLLAPKGKKLEAYTYTELIKRTEAAIGKLVMTNKM